MRIPDFAADHAAEMYGYHRREIERLEPEIRRLVCERFGQMTRGQWLAWCTSIGIVRRTAYYWVRSCNVAQTIARKS